MARQRFVRLLAAASIVVIIGITAWWFFAVYDTAAGRCSRGDLGACVILRGQQIDDQMRDILENVGNSI